MARNQVYLHSYNREVTAVCVEPLGVSFSLHLASRLCYAHRRTQNPCGWIYETAQRGSGIKSVPNPLWPNWLRRSAVNREIGGSIPPGGGVNFFLFTIYLKPYL